MNWYVTFGVQYSHKEHPIHGAWKIHPDGWVRVLADTYDEARRLTEDAFQTRWSNLYHPDDWETEFFPLGELGTIGSDGVLHWAPSIPDQLRVAREQIRILMGVPDGEPV